MATRGAILAHARTDAHDRLIEADEPLAGLQRRCGGELPGTVAVPELLEIVRKARKLGLRLARTIEAADGEQTVRAWVEIAPEADGVGAGCSIEIGSWASNPRAVVPQEEAEARRIAVERAVAELSARLDPSQRLLTAETSAPDLAPLAQKISENPGLLWTELVDLPDLAHRQPLHWRLLDGARCSVEGSARQWRCTLVPLGGPEPASTGFELLLVADSPLPVRVAAPAPSAGIGPSFGSELTPVLRQPIARIIAHAETIRSRLAGPLAAEYSEYAADIASAGQHLLTLVEDLADLELVEADDFTPTNERIDLVDIASRAVGILGVRARARRIVLEAPSATESLPAMGEFRRVLQIMLNLVGNAIAYSPEGSSVRLTAAREGQWAQLAVANEGLGITAENQERVFEKFERLGRSDDGGSGLGLYISRRLARAMAGDLTVKSVAGEGARFMLQLPAPD
jgi:signal transduction histidine kinase